jgi:hypothetical protein
MQRTSNPGPDDAPELGEQIDVTPPAAAELSAHDDAEEPGTLDAEKDPLGGTGGEQAGGAG